jgi:YHS domain-containing protein
VLPKPLAELQPLIAKLSDDLNVPITVLSPNEPWLLCNAGVAGIAFSDGDLAKLAPVAANLRWLDLAGTKITDAGLAHLKPMANLTRLHLERTRITDAGLTRLAALHGLEYLNLYGTPITDAGLPSLQSLPKLKKVYLWQTKVTPRAAQAFAESLTDTDQIKSWQAEIEQIQVKIKNERALVDVGTPPSLTQSTNTIALNEKCPISGKPVDPAKTAVFQGKTIAFCCDDCKAQFEKDPKEVLAKLNLQTAEAGKPR